VSDPKNPKEAGRFWLPGQKSGEEKPKGQPVGFHGPVNVSEDGNTAYLGYAPAVLVLDIRDKANIKVLGRLDTAPPFGDDHSGNQALHTVLPIPTKNLLLVTSEAHAERCDQEAAQLAGLIDIRDPMKPRLMSLLPEPVPPPNSPYKHFCEKRGKFGPHNTNQEQHNPAIEKQGDLLYLTYFNAGLRIVDISNPHVPRETGWFVPPEPTIKVGVRPRERGGLITQTEDVAVDARGNIYITDKQWGVFILRYTGPNKPTPKEAG
jgi:hypothetical protein